MVFLSKLLCHLYSVYMLVRQILYIISVTWAALLVLRNAAILWHLAVGDIPISAFVDFNHYYLTEVLLLKGIIPYGVDFLTLPESSSFILHELIQTATNPPTLAFFLLPLALFNHMTSWIIWETIIFSAVVCSYFIAVRQYGSGWSKKEVVMGFLLFMSSSPVFDVLRNSQISAIILLLVVLGWIALKKDKQIACGVYWGMATALKFFTWPLVLFLLINHKYRSATISSLVTGATIVILPVLFFGSEIYTAFFEHGLSIINSWSQFSTQNWTLGWGVFRTLLINEIDLRKSPIILLILTKVFPMFLLVVFVFLIKRIKPQENSLDIQIASVVGLSLVFSPLSWAHYYLLFLVSMVVFWNYCPRNIFFILTLYLCISGLFIDFPDKFNVQDLVFVFAPSPESTQPTVDLSLMVIKVSLFFLTLPVTALFFSLALVRYRNSYFSGSSTAI